MLNFENIWIMDIYEYVYRYMINFIESFYVLKISFENYLKDGYR